jgi:transcriptional regulator with XRE-family HTH domain
LAWAVAVEKAIFTHEHQRLCQQLRDLRLGQNLRQADLAAQLGVNQTFVSKYERGERRLDLIELRQVCSALGTDLVEFVRQFEKSITLGS